MRYITCGDWLYDNSELIVQTLHSVVQYYGRFYEGRLGSAVKFGSSHVILFCFFFFKNLIGRYRQDLPDIHSVDEAYCV